MIFKYLNTRCIPSYPIGAEYDDTYYYIREVADVINNTFKDYNTHLILIVRGSSGCIIGGGIAYILTRSMRKVSIAISRKLNEVCHGDNLEGLFTLNENKKIIVVDDFIESGNTMEYIIEDLKYNGINRADMLCVANKLSKTKTKASSRDDAVDIGYILKYFKYICCNEA